MAKAPQERTIIEPTRSVIKRIDIGLVTGVCAVLISLMALVTSRAQMKSYKQTQKASVMPVIDIDMGYSRDSEGKQNFDIMLNNVGAGIAYIASVTPTQNGEPITDVQAFEDTLMTRRMRSWATLTASPAAGYLRPGESVTPRAYRMGAASREVSAYLRGEWGTPLDGVDVAICYCSVFEDCWTVTYLDRKRPQAVKTCGHADAPLDQFQNYIAQSAAKRLKAAE